jgi:DNA helicase-2/ATP-dependent DNA helicase PcrA
LIGRIHRIIASGADPKQVLMLTFSRRGAADMRAKAVSAGLTNGVQYRTLHSMALWMLKHSGSERTIVVPKRWQQLKVIRDVLKRFPGARKSANNPSGLTPGTVMRHVDLARAARVWPDEWICKLTGEVFPSFGKWLGEAHSAVATRALSQCYEVLVGVCESPERHGFPNAKNERWVDFNEMIAVAARAIMEEADDPCSWTRNWARMFSYVLVDEAQDNNLGQWTIARHLCGNQLTIVGDVAQSIFGFRGAKPELLEAVVHQPESVVAPLTVNWRSGSAILDTANKILTLVRDESRGKLQLGRRGHVGTVEVDGLSDVEGEADYVVSKIERLVESKRNAYKDFAVLYRINAYSASLELECVRRGIPCKVSGSSFFSSQIVRTILDYLVSASRSDNAEAFGRIYCKPLRGLGREFVNKWPTAEALRSAIDSGFTALGRWKMSSVELIRQLGVIDGLLREGHAALAVRYVCEDVGVRKFFRDEEADDEDETDADEVCKALTTCAARLGSLDALLRMAGAAAGKGDGHGETPTEAVTLSTAHAAKGLEFPVVFCVGMNQGLFPHRKGDRLEELKLGYVAYTRAKDALYISYTRDAGPSCLVSAVLQNQEVNAGATS